MRRVAIAAKELYERVSPSPWTRPEWEDIEPEERHFWIDLVEMVRE